MRRNKPGLRGRIFPILAAGLIGYLIGGWHPGALRASSDRSAADAVALRFPQAWQKVSQTAPPDDALPESGVLHDAGITTAASASVGDARLALLDPAPMIPQSRPQPIAQTSLDPAPPPRVQLASAEAAAPSAALDSDAARARPLPAQPIAAMRPQRPEKSAGAKSMAPPSVAIKSVATLAPRPMSRPGYMLDDAQIASIKERLHLTPDQEQMWPAVEAALRNIAYTRAQQTRSRAGIVQTGDIDPGSVDNLKSAAVPLIMSFNDDQKQEVRNLAHVMGLDQLASEF